MFAAVLVLGSCAGDAGGPEATECEPPPSAEDGGREVTATGGEVHVLGLDPAAIVSGEEVKLVWRVTGAGDLDLTAIAPDGSEVPPVAGPLEHDGSSFIRPGDEWGSVFVFDTPGCWAIEVARGVVGASLPVLVGE